MAGSSNSTASSTVSVSGVVSGTSSSSSSSGSGSGSGYVASGATALRVDYTFIVAAAMVAVIVAMQRASW